MPLMNKSRPCLCVTSLGFQHVVTLLLLLENSCEGQLNVVGPSQPIVALLGDKVVLPCGLQPSVSAADKDVEWSRLNLWPRYVHVWHNRRDYLEPQNVLFRGRTSLSLEKLQHGDLSLTLSNVTLSDSGIYRCILPQSGSTVNLQLVVGSASSPIITAIEIDSSLMALTCLARRWYPQPELSWLDRDGKLLSAGLTEIFRGPDELFAVSSRLSVKEDYSRNITCRVWQRDTNHTRQTWINISASCPPLVPSVLRAVIILAMCIMLAVAVVCGCRIITISEGRECGAVKGLLEAPLRLVVDLRDQTAGLKRKMGNRVYTMETKVKEIDKQEHSTFEAAVEIIHENTNILENRKRDDLKMLSVIASLISYINGVIVERTDEEPEEEHRPSST